VILDDLILKDENNPTYKEFTEEFSSALKKCNQAIEIIPENKEGYLYRGLMIGFYKKRSSIQRYKKKALKDFSKAIKIDSQYLEANYFRGIFGFSTERLSGSTIDGRAYKDIKKAFENNFEPAIEYVKENREFLKEDKCRGF